MKTESIEQLKERLKELKTAVDLAEERKKRAYLELEQGLNTFCGINKNVVADMVDDLVEEVIRRSYNSGFIAGANRAIMAMEMEAEEEACKAKSSSSK